MAKSKAGGTRAYIRGRIGSDVYSIGKDGKGKKQQVVRSLAETVANPQTALQMKGRMIMSTVMQTVSAMSQIIDHSFDNVVAGQPCISEFIRQNYALIKADVTAHPASDNVFGLNKYQEKGAKHGAYVISQGSAALPAAVVNAASAATITIAGSSMTMADLIETLGLGSDDYMTLVGITDGGEMAYCRLHLRSDVAGTTVISGTDLSDFFSLDGNVTPTLAVAGQVMSIALPQGQANSAIIVSRKTSTGYSHNKATLLVPASPAWTADVALATYPEGAERFLNGGGFNGGGVTPEPTPTPTPGGDAEILTVLYGSDALVKGQTNTKQSGSSKKISGTAQNTSGITNPGVVVYTGDAPTDGPGSVYVCAAVQSNGSFACSLVLDDVGTYKIQLMSGFTSENDFAGQLVGEVWGTLVIENDNP